MVLKNQFKKAYANFYNAVKLTQINLGGNTNCYYWDFGQLCREKCTGYDQYGDCNKYSCIDDTPLPPNQNGPRGDCAAFDDELFFKSLKVVKYCHDHGLANGCLTSDYKGTDELKKAQNPDPDYTPNPNASWASNSIKNNWSSYILADGTLIMKHGTHGYTVPIYAIDVNGHKKPNEWGKDIFMLQTFGNTLNGITQVKAATFAHYPLVEGAVTTDTMIKNMYK